MGPDFAALIKPTGTKTIVLSSSLQWAGIETILCHADNFEGQSGCFVNVQCLSASMAKAQHKSARAIVKVSSPQVTV